MPFDSTDFDAPIAVETPERQRVRQLRDFLLWLEPVKLRMSGFYFHPSTHVCGTRACIVGWTVILFDGEGACELPRRSNLGIRAAALLGLDPESSYRLFFPVGYEQNMHKPAQAAAVLDHYLLTGEIDWSVA